MSNRNTIQREIINKAVNELKFHPTPDNIYDYIKSIHPSISRSTVYRNLNILAEQGEISKVRVPGFADRFDYNKHSHYHIVCEKCGKVSDLEMSFFDINSKIKNNSGYNIKDHTIVFFGLCPDCK